MTEPHVTDDRNGPDPSRADAMARVVERGRQLRRARRGTAIAAVTMAALVVLAGVAVVKKGDDNSVSVAAVGGTTLPIPSTSGTTVAAPGSTEATCVPDRAGGCTVTTTGTAPSDGDGPPTTTPDPATTTGPTPTPVPTTVTTTSRATTTTVPRSSTSSSTTTTTTAPVLPRATADPATGPGTGYGHLTAIRVARQTGYDRVVFEFSGDIPGYDIRYVDPPVVMDGSGAPVSVTGDAFLLARFSPASGYDMDAGAPTYTGPDHVAGTGATVDQLAAAGDFEAVLRWAIGVRSGPHRFTVSTLPAPSRIVIDIADA